MNYDIKNLNLYEKGELRALWASRFMPVLKLIKERFEREKPLEGLRIGACLHVTTETANLLETLRAGGAQISLCASNPLSTQDDVAAFLVNRGFSVFAINGEDSKTYYKHIHSVLDSKPRITLDDGGDLVSTIHKEKEQLIEEMIGGTEETTTGVLRFRSMEREGALRYPIIAVNDAQTKRFFDNRYGTGQSTLDGIMRATNFLIAGSTLVVVGYGFCGRGIAMRARGLGAKVCVTEVDPLKALEATMDGYHVLSMADAAKVGDIFVTATGCKDVIRGEHMILMKDSAILCNSGHFNVEISIPDLEELSTPKKKVREHVEEYTLKNGRKLYLLGEGRLINLVAAEGHPASVMDMSFANQALCVRYLKENEEKLENKVYRVPREIDHEIARLKLKSLNLEIDTLTSEQEEYLKSWRFGT
ncbi:MAG: adenosylhomocysteinase [Candidatus Methanofastidiosia archaeon]